jgi:hypothetical protein
MPVDPRGRSPKSRAWSARHRARIQNSPHNSEAIKEYYRNQSQGSPMEDWLAELADVCFAEGRDYERRRMIARRPHWRLWELLQRIAWRLGPYSRIRFLLEPDEDEHVAYREKWRNRFPICRCGISSCASSGCTRLRRGFAAWLPPTGPLPDRGLVTSRERSAPARRYRAPRRSS